jgi:glucosamine 6-phosphate synthetase-like amidotransferase/phosphosugar isomerase protein
MCGVFGFVAEDDNDRPNPEVLMRIARVTELRGRHAWGMAWIDSKGILKHYKQTGPISDSLGLLRMAADAQVLIGHCRYATQGSPESNLNNHPHACDGGWIVHNGMIPDYQRLLKQHSLLPNSDCDSEVLALLIERLPGQLKERVDEAVSYICRPQPLVLLGIWKPGTLIAVRRGNPLWMGESKRGTYLASLPEGLPGNVSEVPDGTLMDFQP